MGKTKKCRICNKTKNLSTDNFNRNANLSDGFANECKECRAQYRRRNKKDIQKYNEQHYKKNRETIGNRRKKYYEENKDVLNRYNRQYHQKNKELINKRSRLYNQENRERLSLYQKDYVRKNAEQIRIYNQSQRALKRSLPHTLTAKEWEDTLSDFDVECAYCGMCQSKHLKKHKERLHQEHIVPLSKGGGYTKYNIIPSCISCNGSKRDKDFNKWYPNHESYDEERHSFILRFIKENTRPSIL